MYKKLRKLKVILKKEKWWIALSCTACLVEALITIYLTYITKNLTDMVVNRKVQEFIMFLKFAGVAIVANVIFGYVSKYSLARYKTHFGYSIRNFFMNHIIKLSPSSREEYTSGDIISRVNNDISIITDLVGYIPELIKNPVVFICAFIYMYLISWKLLLIGVILMPLSSYLFNKVSKPIEINSKKIMEDTAKLNSLAKDTINGVYVLKAFNLNEVLLNKYKKNIHQVVKRGMKLEKINSNLMRLFLTLRYIPQLTIPLCGGYLAIKGEITVGELLASIELIWYIFSPIEAMLEFKKQMRNSTPAVERVFEVMDKSVEYKLENSFEIKEYCPVIGFSKVYYSYDKEKPVIKNLSFELQKGKITALVGASGSGKTTILKLLCGFCEGYAGSVKVFGNQIKDYNLLQIRNNIALVSQNNFLFPTTIAENIAYGRNGASKEEIINSSKLANAHDFIMSTEHGYDTIIGDGNHKLSGGQMQRISLARAILKNAPILLLDEATSALDPKTEILIQKSLEDFMKERTVLVVAHKMVTIKNADNILVIKDGEIIEEGNHESLMNMDSFYKKLYLKQYGNECKATVEKGEDKKKTVKDIQREDRKIEKRNRNVEEGAAYV